MTRRSSDLSSHIVCVKVRVVDVQTDPCQMVIGLGCLGDQLRSDRWLKEFPDCSGLFSEAENTQKTGILMISPCIQIIAPVVQNDMEETPGNPGGSQIPGRKKCYKLFC